MTADEIVCLTPKPLDSNKNSFEGMSSTSHYKCLFSMTLRYLGRLLYACLELSSFSRSFKDKLTISSQTEVEILYNIPD